MVEWGDDSKLGNLIPSICPKIMSGDICEDENCCFIHLNDYSISKSTVLKINDLFYIKEMEKSNHIIKKVINTKQNLMVSDSNPPVLCYICYDPVISKNSYAFPCCNIFCCKSCFDSWKYKGHCPSCGDLINDTSLPTESDALIIQKSNSMFLGHEICFDGPN